MTKFDQDEIKMRQAFSMGAKDQCDDGEWSVGGGDEDINSGTHTNYADDVKNYMRERRFSWPLLK